MEGLANRIAEKLAAELGFDEEKKEVMAYGLFGILQTALTFLCAGLCGLLLGAWWQSLLICLSGGVLRKFSGGVHASTPALCLFISVVVCAAGGYFSLWLGAHFDWRIGIPLALCWMAACLIFYKNAPLGHENKPICGDAKRRRLRRGTFAVLAVDTILFLAFGLLGGKIPGLYAAALCLWVGVCWQSLTLTRLFRR